MLITEKMQNAFNRQINREFYSAYLYLSMAAYFDSINFKGFASWMKAQANEEYGHAMKMYDFVYDRGGRVIMEGIESPKSNWDSPLDVFENVYEHEKKVTQMIHELVKLAREEKDIASESFLKWYVDEQVEEEANALEIVERLKMIKDSPNALFMLDSILGKRGKE